ncbi:uncharacterized protein LOC62_02G002166 [Vanrija pseudolonga]|uniref:Uncharacterized protein n=1 Tax=Vanrija pseudolonga TaxID=143232 RepID=A0AAF0Y268_9TREE|nr:hypothetical protein LOC62_02G002166 [Vanrija pseudolonga]
MATFFRRLAIIVGERLGPAAPLPPRLNANRLSSAAVVEIKARAVAYEALATPSLSSSTTSLASSGRPATPDRVSVTTVEVAGGMVPHPAYTVLSPVVVNGGVEYHLLPAPAATTTILQELALAPFTKPHPRTLPKKVARAAKLIARVKAIKSRPRTPTEPTTRPTGLYVKNHPNEDHRVQASIAGPKATVNSNMHQVPPTSASFLARTPDPRVFIGHVTGSDPESVYVRYNGANVDRIESMKRDGVVLEQDPLLDSQFPLLGEGHASSDRFANAVGRLSLVEAAAENARLLRDTANVTASTWAGPADCKTLLHNQLDNYTATKIASLYAEIDRAQSVVSGIISAYNVLDSSFGASKLAEATRTASATIRSIPNFNSFVASISGDPYTVGGLEFAVTCPRKEALYYPTTHCIFKNTVVQGSWEEVMG